MAFIHGSKARLVGNGMNLGKIAKSFTAEGEIKTGDGTVIESPGREFTMGVESGTYQAEGFLDAGTGGTSAAELIQSGFKSQGVIISAPISDAVGAPAIGLVAGTTKAAVVSSTEETAGYSVSGETQNGFEPGRVALGWAARTGAMNGATIDAGAASTGGASALLVVGAFTGTNCVVKIQHSVDGSTWVDYATFATITAGRGGQRITVAPGTLNRYRRAIIASGTFTSVELMVMLAAK